MTETETFEVFAIKYATHARDTALNFIDRTDIHDGPMPLDYFVWLARSGTRTIVVDTGFNAAAAKARGRTLIRCPSEGLAMLGVDAAAVEDVVITHLHYDHAGNLDLFPSARLHLQDREMAFATGRHMCHRPFRDPMNVDDVVAMVRRVYADRVEFHDGDEALAPGFTLHRIGGHTAGLQVARVFTGRGWVVLASDASHLYANMERVNPFPIVFRLDDMVAGYGTLKRLADTPGHIVPGHDPLVMERYPAPAPELAGIAVRLDVAGSGGG